MSRRRRPLSDPTAEKAEDPQQYRLEFEKLLRSLLTSDELMVIRCVFGINGQPTMTFDEIAAECQVPVEHIERHFYSAMNWLHSADENRDVLQDFLDTRFPGGVPDFSELDQEDWCPVHQLRIIRGFGKSELRCKYCNCWLAKTPGMGRPSVYCDDRCRKGYAAWKRREKVPSGGKVEKFRLKSN